MESQGAVWAARREWMCLEAQLQAGPQPHRRAQPGHGNWKMERFQPSWNHPRPPTILAGPGPVLAKRPWYASSICPGSRGLGTGSLFSGLYGQWLPRSLRLLPALPASSLPFQRPPAPLLLLLMSPEISRHWIYKLRYLLLEGRE